MSIDTILGIIGTLLGIIGLITGYIFYRKSLRLKEPCFIIVSNNLIVDNITNLNGLEILFKNQRVQTLTVSKVLFWNHGFDTIEKGDIVLSDPLRIEASPDVQILDTSIVQTNNPSSKFLLKRNAKKSSVELIFDYLDKDNGVIIQVIHTGKSSNNINFMGKIKGANLIDLKFTKRAYIYSILIATLTCFLVVIASIFMFKFTSTLGDLGKWISGAYLLILFVVFPTAMVKFMGWLEPRLSGLPKDFNDFIVNPKYG